MLKKTYQKGVTHYRTHKTKYRLVSLVVALLIGVTSLGRAYHVSADTTATIISPSDQDTVSGSPVVVTVSVTGGIADAVDVVFIDGHNIRTPFPASFNGHSGFWNAAIDSTSLADGNYTVLSHVTAGRTDFDGSSITLTVSNVLTPVVTVTTPSESATLSGSNSTLAAIVTNATADSLEFLLTVDQNTQHVPATYDSHAGGWGATFDTTVIDDNTSITIVAEASISHAFVDSNEVHVTINNAGGGGLSVSMTNPSHNHAVISGDGYAVAALVSGGSATDLSFIIDSDTRSPISGTFDSRAGIWRGNWDTTHFSNGDHTIKAIASNGHTPFESSEFSVIVSNGSLQITTPASRDTVSSITNLVAVPTGFTPNTVTFRIENGAQVTIVDAAFDSHSNTWKYSYDPSQFVNGPVVVRATADGQITSDGVSFSNASPVRRVSIAYPVENQEPGQYLGGGTAYVSGDETPPRNVTFQYAPYIGNIIGSGAYLPDAQYGTYYSAADLNNSRPGNYTLTVVADFGNGETVQAVRHFTIPPLLNATFTSPSECSVSGVISIRVTPGVVLDEGLLSVQIASEDRKENISIPTSYDSRSGQYIGTLDTADLPEGGAAINFGMSKSGYLPNSVSQYISVRKPCPNATASDPEASNSFIQKITSPNNGSSVSGLVPIIVNSSEALKNVIIEIYQGGRGVPTTLQAKDNKDRTWSVDWDTTGLSGSYVIVATLTTERTAMRLIPITVTVTGSEEKKDQTKTARSLTLSEPIEEEYVTGTTRLGATTDDVVDEVTFDITSTNTKAITISAQATDRKKTSWNGSWDTSKVNDGSYTITARSKKVNVIATSTAVTIHVANHRSQAEIDKEKADKAKAEEEAKGDDATVRGDYTPDTARDANPSIDVALKLPENKDVKCTAGSLIKLQDDGNQNTTSDTAIYYCGQDGKRYSFPNDRIFHSWFADFSGIVVVSFDQMASLELGGSISYRPGTRMVKIQSDPRVYAVARGNVLRWVTTEAIARRLYGNDWNTKIDDVPDSFFFNYEIGASINE